MTNTPGKMNARHHLADAPTPKGHHPARRRTAGFTLIELLVVIGIIALLAGLLVGMAGYATRKNRESAIRGEMNRLITAIDSYQAAFGQYPPDTVVSRTPLIVDPVVNPLYYELTGTVVDNTTRTFLAADGQTRIPAALVQSNFRMEGFVNAKPDPKELKSLPITFKSTQYGTNNSTPPLRLLAVPVKWPLNLPPIIPGGTPGLNPWRYVSTSPTNNPTTYDLWAEYVEGKKIKTIGNWTKEILERPL